jgi:hypothetical protein
MPNDCWNYLTITADKEQITQLLENEFKEHTEDTFRVLKRGVEAVHCKVWSAWHPDFAWLETLLTKYTSCWVKNVWLVEDGEAGVWIGTARKGKVEIRSLDWEEMSIEEEMYRYRL